MSEIPNRFLSPEVARAGTARNRALWMLGMACATLLLHLAVGVYYATHAENLPKRTSLRLQGEDYLASFPGWGEYETDSTYYNRTAVTILQTGLPRRRHGAVTLHAPLYSYFVAACYALGGIRLLPVALAQAVLSGLTAWLLGTVALRMAPPQRWWIGPMAAALYLVNLRFAMYVGYVYPTILILTLFAAMLGLATMPLTSQRLILFALLLIAGVFAQANGFLLAGAGILWLLWQRNQLALLVGIAVAVVAACKVALGTFSSEQKQTGVLWEANNPHYESMRWSDLWEQRPGNPWSNWSPSPLEQQRYRDYLRRAGQLQTEPGWLWIRENPRPYAKLCLLRLRNTLGPFTGQMSPRHRAIATVYWLLIFPAGFYGWWRMRHLPLSRFALCVYLVLTAFETLVISDWYLRYRLLVDLMLTAYAAVGYQALRRRRPAP